MDDDLKDYMKKWKMNNIFEDLIHSIFILKPENPLIYSLQFFWKILEKQFKTANLIKILGETIDFDLAIDYQE